MSIKEIDWDRLFYDEETEKYYIPTGYYRVPLVIELGMTDPYLHKGRISRKPTKYKQIMLQQVASYSTLFCTACGHEV